MVGVEIRTNAREHAGSSAASRLNRRALAMQAIHVGRWTAQVRDDAGESLHIIAYRLDLANDGVFRAALDDPALMFGDRTERTSAETSALNRHGETNHVVGGYLRLCVGG